MHAVLLHVGPCLVRRNALVDAVGLDQAQERLAREIELAHRWLDVAEHRPRGLSFERERHLLLDLVESGQPIPVVGVTELVYEPGIAIEGAHVRAQRAGKENRADREIFPGGPRCDLGHLHGSSIEASFATDPQRCLNLGDATGGVALHRPGKERGRG